MVSASARVLRVLVSVSFVALAPPLFAQQTGAISGTVTATDGSLLPGVTVEARSDVLPGPRATVTGANGEYRLPALPPGIYTVTFNLSGMQTVHAQGPGPARPGNGGRRHPRPGNHGDGHGDGRVLDHRQGLGYDRERSLQRPDPRAAPRRRSTATCRSSSRASSTARTPCAGRAPAGSGQDNVYQFDGVNVTLPFYGTLSAEPASHDIAQVTVIKGGARAVDFDRSGGFSIDSVSKSGTSQYLGQVSYLFQSNAMSADLDTRQPVPLRAGPRLAEREPRRAGHRGPSLLLRLLLPPDERPGEPGQPLRRAPELREHAQRGLRQADLHPERSPFS